MSKPIEKHWLQIVKESQGMCCSDHLEMMRAMYFAGAMAAFSHATNWDPEAPSVLYITALGVAEVRDELTAVFHNDTAPNDLVRH